MNEDKAYDIYTEADRYVIYLRSNEEKERPIIIDRINRKVIVADFDTPQSGNVLSVPSTIYGIIGSVKLLSGRYLITIDECELIGVLFDHRIYKAVKISLLIFSKSTLHLNETELEMENTYINMLTHVAQIEGFFFSYTYDLTISNQRLSELGPESKNENIFDRADKQFLWNSTHLQDWANLLSEAITKSKPYLAPKLSSYLTPIIFGFVGILKSPQCSDSTADLLSYAIISRRSVYRAGTRFYARGLDSAAHAANTVETEQIIYIPPDNIFSFVQMRGSVPLFWSQRPNLKYKPNVKMGRLVDVEKSPADEALPDTSIDVEPEQTTIIQRYFQEACHVQQYGRTICINLLDQKGMERRLCRTFALAAQNVNPAELKYESFDFHRECKAMQWHRLSILLNRLEPEIVSMGLFRLRISGQNFSSSIVQAKQSGVFRTNCIDCLDRTNVVQSMIARRVIDLGLKQLGFGSNSVECQQYLASVWPDFETQFKCLWADNADVLSVQYSGTRALKTDFTRTGKRTVKGMLMDGYHSAIRYYLNNFVDGYRQDAMNLFLGHYKAFEADGTPKPLPGKPNNDEASLRTKFMPIIFAFATSMSALCLLFPTEQWSEQIMYFLFWGTASVMSAFTIFTYGDDFVNKPLFPME